MKDKLMKRIFLLLVIILIIVAIIIVTKQNKNKKEQSTGNTEEKKYITELRIGISAMDTFDPLISTNKNVQDVCKLVYESLLTVDEKFKAQGVLAEEWAKTAENSYIIKLKQGVKFHNGTEFTSTDVEFSINKIKGSTKSIYKENVKNISNITLIDKYTIRLDLIEDEAFFEYNLIFPIESANDSNEANSNIPSGTGPYKVYQISNNKIELTRNPYRENVENVLIKSIIVNNYKTIGELYNDFKIGNVDLFNTDSTEYSNYIGTLGYTTINFYGRKFNFLAINTKQIALYNIEVRRAINYAIDKNAIVSNVYNTKYYMADYPLNYGNWLYSADNTSSGYNPEQSKKILEDNGWQYTNNVWHKNINNQNVQLIFNLVVSINDSKRVEVAESIKQQLEEIGIKVNITKVSSVNEYVQNKNYDMALLEMNVSVKPDLSIFFGENNLENYNNPESLEIISEIKDISDENTLKQKYNKLLEIYKNDIPFVSLYFSNSTVIYNSKMTGAITPTWYNLYYNIENWRIEE